MKEELTISVQYTVWHEIFTGVKLYTVNFYASKMPEEWTEWHKTKIAKLNLSLYCLSNGSHNSLAFTKIAEILAGSKQKLKATNTTLMDALEHSLRIFFQGLVL